MSFGTDANNDPTVTVNATAVIKTFLIGLLPQFKTLNVSSVAQSTRPPLIMSLVLDRSGSMNFNGGAQALAPAVENFIGYFIDGTDQVAEISFSSTATVDVPMTTTFTNPITNSVTRMAFVGATFAQGGLLDAQSQINGVASPGPKP